MIVVFVLQYFMDTPSQTTTCYHAYIKIVFFDESNFPIRILDKSSPTEDDSYCYFESLHDDDISSSHDVNL